VSLCRIHGNNKVEVLYFDGQGDRGLESAGVAFDRRCVQQAYTAKHGEPLEENDPQFIRLLAEFEAVKIGSHGRVTRKLLNCLKAPDIYGDQELYLFGGGYSVTFAQVQSAFAAIARGIEQVIQRLKHWLKQQEQTIDRLFLVGGFSQFLLVEQTIRDSLEISQEDVAPQFALPLDYETYLQHQVDKKQRHEIRRKQRRIEREAKVDFTVVGVASTHNRNDGQLCDLDREIDEFIRLQRASREDKAEFMTPEMQRFFRAMAHRMAEAGFLRLCFLSLNGQKAAVLFAFEYNQRFLLYNSGYDPDAYAHLSPGWVILAYTIQYL